MHTFPIHDTFFYLIYLLISRIKTRCVKNDEFELIDHLFKGPNVVSFISETASNTYITREFLIRNLDRNMERRLTHFLYTAWPDHGVLLPPNVCSAITLLITCVQVPNSSKEILDFRKQVRMITPPSSTLLVHCRCLDYFSSVLKNKC